MLAENHQPSHPDYMIVQGSQAVEHLIVMVLSKRGSRRNPLDPVRKMGREIQTPILV